MQIDPYILAFSAITVAVTIWMGFRSARTSKTASDFFVAGRSVSVGWNASAISGEYLSAASFMGVAGMVMSSGYDALWYPVCYACGYLFLLLFIAGPLRRFGAYTIPDFAEGRFDSPLFRKIAVVFVLFIGFFYTMPQMKGAGTTLAYIFPGLPYWAGVVLVGAVITLNVALGGMKGITLVQAFQYWIKMFAISVPIFVLMAVYGNYGAQLDAQSANNKSDEGVTDLGVSAAGDLSQFQRFEPGVLVRGTDGDALSEVKVIGKVYVNNVMSGQRLQISTLGATVKYGDRSGVLSFYARISRQTVYLAPELVQTPLPPFAISNVTYGGLVAEFESICEESNSVAFVRGKDKSVWIVPEAKAPLLSRELTGSSILREQLPEKAPADATWLNPFGPLTTKAANAAKPQITYNGPLTINRYGSPILNRLNYVLFESYRNTGLPKPDDLLQVRLTNHSAFDLVLFTTTEWQYSGKLAELRTSPALTNHFIAWTNSQPIKLRDYREVIGAVLRANGVTLQDEGSVVTAFLTKDARITPVDPRPYSLLYTYSLIIAIVCGTAGLPHILVRFYTNPDGVAAKRTTMWVMILIGVFYVFPPVFGVIGRNLLPELYSGVGAKGTDKVVLELPRLLNSVGRYSVDPTSERSEASAASVSSAVTNSDARSARADVVGNQGSTESRPTRQGGIPWGSILSGITCAGAFAAFMSTFSGLLVSMTGALAHDVYGRMLNPKASPEQRMKMFKWCAVLIGGVAVLLGSFVEPLEINFMVGQAFAIAAASYFPLLFMAVWWRKLTMKGAATGMLTGGLSALIGISLTSFSTLASAPGKTGELFALFRPLNDFWAAHPLLRILCEQPAIWAVPLAIILMVIVSKLTSKDVPEDIRMKMLVLHAPEKLGLKQEYIQEHQHGH